MHIFIENKSFICKINYDDNIKSICIEENVEDYWIYSCYYKRTSFWETCIIHSNIDYLFWMEDDLFSQYDFTDDKLVIDILKLKRSFKIVDCKKGDYIKIEVYIRFAFV